MTERICVHEVYTDMDLNVGCSNDPWEDTKVDIVTYSVRGRKHTTVNESPTFMIDVNSFLAIL